MRPIADVCCRALAENTRRTGAKTKARPCGARPSATGVHAGRRRVKRNSGPSLATACAPTHHRAQRHHQSGSPLGWTGRRVRAPVQSIVLVLQIFILSRLPIPPLPHRSGGARIRTWMSLCSSQRVGLQARSRPLAIWGTLGADSTRAALPELESGTEHGGVGGPPGMRPRLYRRRRVRRACLRGETRHVRR